MKGHLRFSHSTTAQFGVQLKKKTTRIPLLPKSVSKAISYGRRMQNRG
jgi:hypothetical protein